jgi:hypothetical protein
LHVESPMRPISLTPCRTASNQKMGLQGIEWVIWGIIAAEKLVDRGFLKL